tara:strand:- start:72 stop:1547 length:1476 start_codon:yes stop_codon:yes gene_type:complete
MRIAFVQDIIQFSVPLGTTLIAGNLRHAGHEVGLYVVEGNLDKTLKELESYKPDAVAFSVITGSHLEYIKIARTIKQKLGIPIIWGGPHATFFPKIIEEDYADAVCVGEGEDAALDFANAFDNEGKKIPTKIPNFWVKRDGVIYRNTVRPRIKNLDELPYPARDLFLNKFPMLKNHGIKHFLAHRGCPHKCTYCFNHTYNKMYREQAGDKKVFFSRTPDSIVDEILWLKKSETIKTVAFVDDVFTLHKKWTLEFAEVYEKHCGIPFSINARFDHMDEEIISALAKAGLSLVHCGIESGNEYMRNKVMVREQTLESIFLAGNLLKKYGVKLLTENVLGNPGETFKMAVETLELNIKLKPVIANASIFAPYPGLKMTQYAIDNGYFDGNFDKLEATYYDSSVLKFKNKEDERKIYNLRCFFSLLTQHPWLMFFIKPLLYLPFKKFFWTIGNIIDGYYLRKGLAYKQKPFEFLGSIFHFLTNYRNSLKLSKDNT